jgi:LEA14-like dessication related protein
MKRNVYAQIVSIILLIFAFSCSGPKDPSFEKFDNLKVKSITPTKVTLIGVMILHNPNPFSCNLKDMHLEVFSDKNIKLTEISQTYNTEMVANSDFKLPVQISFAPDKLLDEKRGLFTSIISVLNEKEVTLNYKGTCKVEAMEIAIEVPFDFEETTMLKEKD